MFSFKKLMKTQGFQAFASKALAFLMRFCFYTTRWKYYGKDRLVDCQNRKEPFLLCVWHDRLMTIPCAWDLKYPLNVLASNHSDGKLIAKIVENFSMNPIYGSTGKGMVAAKNIIKLLRNKEYVAIIPDGPRGPRHTVAQGAIMIAKFTKTPIMPCSCCVKRYTKLKSWDKFILAHPFNDGAVVIGDPITPEILESFSEQEAAEYVAAKINEASEKAYRMINDVTHI